MRRFACALSLLVGAMSVVGLPACSRGPSDGALAPADRSGVLLVTLDTFRADRAGCMGHPGGLTPAIDRALRTGLLTRNAYAPAPLTAVSHATVLTGQEPQSHGVRENWLYPLPPDVPTLATRLGEAGYRTGGFIAGFPLLRRFGFAQGFERYDDLLAPAGSAVSTAAERPADQVVDSALGWVSGLPAGDDWFAWVHFFDPHYPWRPVAPLRRLPAAGAYERELRATDRELGRLLRGLDAAGRRPLVAIATDHGEGLDDHGELTHGVLLYRELTQALLGIAAPAGSEVERRIEGGIRDEVARLSDLVPTLLDALDLEGAADLDGRSLLRAGEDDVSAYSETYYPETHYRWSPLLSLRTGRWSYIDAPEPELFDLQQDPGETRNVIDVFPQVAAEMSVRLAALAAPPAAPDEADGQVSEEVQERLEALGYVAHGDGGGGERGPDPKGLISAANGIVRGLTLRAEGRVSEAVGPLRRAYQVDPQNVTAAYQLANCFRDLGQPAMARDYYRRVAELDPRAGEAYVGLAGLEAGSGHVAEAIRIIEEGLAIAPGRLDLLLAAGDLHRDAGQRAAARDYYEQARERSPHSPDPWIALAQLAEREGRKADAGAAWKAAAHIDPFHAAVPAEHRPAAPRDR